VCFRKKFPKLNEAKLKERIIIGPLIHVPEFRRIVSFEAAWNTFKSFCTIFIAENYSEIVSEMLKGSHVMKCNILL
jgi:hypothetical protein